MLYSMLTLAATCTGPYRGQTLNRAEILTILQEAKKTDTINLCGTLLSNINLSKVNLHGVDLSYASLQNAQLEQADLSRAILVKTNLSGANLQSSFLQAADLTQANLTRAQLQNSIFHNTVLIKANLTHAILEGIQLQYANVDSANLAHVQGKEANFNFAKISNANFYHSQLNDAQFEHSVAIFTNFNKASLKKTNFKKSNLQHATFIGADLTNALMQDTDISQVNFHQANLREMEYYPTLDGLPNLDALSKSKNFATMHFSEKGFGPLSLLKLQLAYQKKGLRAPERLITSMLKQHEMQRNFNQGGFHTLLGILQYIFFYLPCEFGLDPMRPLWIGFAFFMLATIPYYLSLGSQSPYAGILIQWPSKRDHNYLLEASYQHFVKIYPTDPWIIASIKRYRMVLTALYLSLLSSLKIGFDDFNLAHWITYMQSREYNLIPRGWVRSLAGFQAIFCAYLLLLWAITLFGRPFEVNLS
ncbi:MAG TPA: pentapeptide repeat-containing protein [Gammaproteobacteria bacterium]|nr:pentapeptide repeat-containing protein [Gammaproteobacteria bacterium]